MSPHRGKKRKPEKKVEKKIEKPHVKKLRNPRPKDVDRFLQKMAEKAINVDRILNRYLAKYHLKGKNNEYYWRLKGNCVLIGKETHGTTNPR